MDFEFDEKKRLTTLAKHKIDFLDAAEILQSQHLIMNGRSEIEERKIAVEQLGGSYLAVVFTMRGDRVRIIIARKARQDEREQYQAVFSGRNPENKK